MGKPGGGIWLEMESMPGFHCRQTLLHSRAQGGVVVCVPQEGSLWGCSVEGSALCEPVKVWVRPPLPHFGGTKGKFGCGQCSEPYGKVDTAQVGSRFTWCEILGEPEDRAQGLGNSEGAYSNFFFFT